MAVCPNGMVGVGIVVCRVIAGVGAAGGEVGGGDLIWSVGVVGVVDGIWMV